MSDAFTRSEALAIMEVCIAPDRSPCSASNLWLDVSHARSWIGRKHNVDLHALGERLRALSYAECLAVIDAVERFWSSRGDVDSALTASGLIADAENAHYE